MNHLNHSLNRHWSFESHESGQPGHRNRVGNESIQVLMEDFEPFGSPVQSEGSLHAESEL